MKSLDSKTKPRGMELHGQAMLDCLNGDENAHYILRRDDGAT